MKMKYLVVYFSFTKCEIGTEQGREPKWKINTYSIILYYYIFGQMKIKRNERERGYNQMKALPPFSLSVMFILY